MSSPPKQQISILSQLGGGAMPDAENDASNARVKSVVLIDDHPAVRVAIRSILESQGTLSVVAEAGEGVEGLDKVRKFAPDLVVVDLSLPDIDGLELIHRIKSYNSAVRVLVLSARDERLYAVKVMQAGGNGFVNKTKDISDILHAATVVTSGFNCFPVLHVGSSGNGDPDLLSKLSVREMTVLLGLAVGDSNKDLADKLCLSQKTISTYKMRILEKLHLSSVADLVTFAKTNHLVD
ncbi:response regulator [Uliginosibacterium sp. sgz301328]|uniref:response regulator n=1 Tax=Uliginosibacterium sp. sgz301328 TaxID=3243764 RepID=UPI00359D2EE0